MDCIFLIGAQADVDVLTTMAITKAELLPFTVRIFQEKYSMKTIVIDEKGTEKVDSANEIKIHDFKHVPTALRAFRSSIKHLKVVYSNPPHESIGWNQRSYQRLLHRRTYRIGASQLCR